MVKAKQNIIFHYNLLTKSQISFKIKTDKLIQGYNKVVITDDKRILIIGRDQVFEYQLVDNSFKERANMI